MDLSVVSPAYNEAATLDNLLRRLTSVLEELDLEWEIVLVDDGSTDDTWAHLRRGGRTGSADPGPAPLA